MSHEPEESLFSRVVRFCRLSGVMCDFAPANGFGNPIRLTIRPCFKMDEKCQSRVLSARRMGSRSSGLMARVWRSRRLPGAVSTNCIDQTKWCQTRICHLKSRLYQPR